MNRLLSLLVFALLATACTTYAPTPDDVGSLRQEARYRDEPLTASLFNSDEATISEEDIQRILDGEVVLPDQLRVAVLNLDSYRTNRRYYYYSSEFYRDQAASYIDLFRGAVAGAGRDRWVKQLPNLLTNQNQSVTTLRESAVRLQADALLVFSVGSDIYSETKIFRKDELKAYATAEALLMDIRTGIIVFATTETRDAVGQRVDTDTGSEDVRRRIQFEAATAALTAVAQQLTTYLTPYLLHPFTPSPLTP